jgi:hypothetical protein
MRRYSTPRPDRMMSGDRPKMACFHESEFKQTKARFDYL